MRRAHLGAEGGPMRRAHLGAEAGPVRRAHLRARGGPMTRVLAIAAIAAAVLSAPARADVPPVPGGTKCGIDAQATFRHAAVLRQGVPVRVTCDGPATLMVFLEFSDFSSAHRWTLSNVFPESDPGPEAFTRSDVVFAEGGTRTVRLRYWPWAQRVVPRFPRTRVNVLLAVKREDGEFWRVSGRTQMKRSVLVR
jgi:hypothetical protein